ncbi:FkbM family methyltransferase [Paenibacillus sp. NPDC056579]|uniref:FkbM family methyltransferase n=1 Tax=unclassified Paenibacillus TaxID=185978 RepID=UPI001EF95C90|nr:FkbM family methyltransferase [Paenibacillus sp. H1-7]ULL17967.1 FkbM family methyltransferase [Paenibacillus sp. H1-7]
MSYYSQFGQDKYLNELVFEGKCGGYFVDIGAYDGVTFSNSYFFEKQMGWNGICVEPMPHIYNQLIRNRKCVCIEGAIAGEEREQDFLVAKGVEMLSGLVDSYDIRHLNLIDSYKGEKEIIRVNTFKLQSILDNNQIKHIDFCSIDTEGSELKVIQSIDLDKVDVRCFVVENNYHDSVLREYLLSRNYSLVERIVVDDIFVKNG